MKIEIPGQPIAKARPRFKRIGRYVKTYNIQKQEEDNYVGAIMAQVGNNKPTDSAVFVDINFFVRIPKSTNKKMRLKMQRNIIFPIKKNGDLDNYIKWVLDCITKSGCVWIDDSQVVGIFAWKKYSDEPKTIFSIIEV